jgi:diguanylate cyclase (GGDEF)-like protein
MTSANQSKNKISVERLADESGLAVIVVDENSTTINEANNNSICRVLYSSEDFSPRCAEFCGKAFSWAQEAQAAVEYECYAGLSCIAMPLKNEEKPLVGIVGRTFLKASKYRQATERTITGDWQKFSPSEIFGNVLMTISGQHLEKTARKLEKLEEEKQIEVEKGLVSKLPISNVESEIADEIQKSKIKEQRANAYDSAEIAAWRILFSSLLKLSYKQSCEAVLEFLKKRYGLVSMIWLERRENRLEIILSSGKINEKQIQIGVSVDDERLLKAAQNETSLELRERKTAGSTANQQTINLFPIAVGGEVRSALAIADRLEHQEIVQKIARFCRTVASELEILRLREELSARDWLRNAVRKFNEGLRKIDTGDFWLNLTQISADLLRAERASLLIFNEKSKVLQAKASVGAPEDLTLQKEIGGRVAQKVLQSGEPLIVGNISQIGLPSAPFARNYQTESFISYPISIGARKIAVMNFTDRTDRRNFEEIDLEILRSIAPQIAVAIDHANLKNETGELRHLSVTDSLTGLVNRRYLEERLTEEIKRSNRHGYPMAFLMIDVDFFKSYNDSFGHTEGDKALKIVGNALKETLRGADVAARYGGEEFSILLPQTTAEEAETIAERVRRNIERLEFPKRNITVSIGIASCSLELNSCENLISAADKALYEAKRKGRNNVQIYENLGKED